MKPVVVVVADIAAPEAFRELCRDELSGIDVAGPDQQWNGQWR